MATIANLAVQISGNPSGLMAALDQAERRLEKFREAPNRLAAGLRKGAAFVGDALANPLGTLEQLSQKIPYVGGLLSLLPEVAGKAWEAFKEGSAHIRDVSLASIKLGLDVGTMAGILFAAGPASEAMERSMFRLGAELGALSAGSEEAQKKFRKLGFDVQAVARMSTADALRLIADRVQGLSNAGERAHLVMELFGKRGAELLPILSRGSAGLDAARQKMEALGLSFSQVDADNVRQAGLALKQMGLALQAVKNQVAIGIAPILAELGASFQSAGFSAKGFSSTVIDIAEVIAQGGAIAVEAWKGLTLVWDALGAGFKVMAAGVASGLAKLLEMVESVLNNPGVRKALQLADPLGLTQALDAAGNIDLGAGRVRGEAAKLWEGLDQDRKAFIDKWANDKSAFTKVEDFFRRVRERAAKGVAGPAGEAGGLAEAQRLAKLYDEAQKLKEEMKSPLEKFDQSIAKLGELRQAGLIDPDLFDRASSKAFQDLEKTLDKAGRTPPAALVEGSREAYSAVLKAQNEGAGMDVQQRIEDVLKEAKLIQQKQLEASERVADALGDVTKRGI